MLKSNSGWAMRWLMILYTGLGWYVVLMPYIYFAVAIVSYIVMLFVALLSANFFAVSHAWLEGNGFVSSYAQRGYPSLLFSAINPILIVISFFVYMFSIEFIFKYVGYSYEIAVTQLVSLSAPNVFGGLAIFTVLVGLIMAIHRIMAKLILSVVDRVMRTIGVHEALSSNDFTPAVEQSTESSNRDVISGGSDAINNTTPTSRGPIAQDKSKGGGSSSSQSQSSFETQNSDNQKFSDTASSNQSQSQAGVNSSQSAESHSGVSMDQENQNINPISGGEEQPSQGPIQGGNDSGQVIEGGSKANSESTPGTKDSHSEEKTVVQPHPNNSGLSGAASKLGTYVSQMLSKGSNKTEVSTSSQDGEKSVNLPPEDNSKIEDSSEAIREAESFTSKIEDSASSPDQVVIEDEDNKKPELNDESNSQDDPEIETPDDK